MRAGSRRVWVLVGLIVLLALWWWLDGRAEPGSGDPAPRVPATVAEGDPPPLPGPESTTPGDADPDPSAAGGTLPGADADRPTHELVVTVRDADGRPVEKALVRVSRPDFDVEIASPSFLDPVDTGAFDEEVASARTDEGGVARLDVAVATNHRVSAECDTGVHEIELKTPAGPGTTEVAIELRPGFRLSGIARRPDGRPVAQAQVWVSAPVPGSRPRHLMRIRTDAKGRFAFRTLPLPGTRNLRIYVMGSNEPGTAVEVPSRAGRIDDVLVTMPVATVIRGRCVTEDGKPLRNVRVRGFLPASGEITFTNAGGHFSMKVPGDGGGLLFWVAGRVQVLLRDLGGPPEGKDIGDVVIPKGGVIAGRVRTADGKPAAGAELCINDPSTYHNSHHATLGATGEFRSDVIGPGAHTILVRRALSRGDGKISCWYAFKPWFAGTTGIDLTLPDGVWTRIRLIDEATGEAALFRKGIVLGEASGETGWVIHRTFNEDGDRTSLEVQFPAPGEYRLGVHWGDRALTAERTVRVTGDEDQIFELRAR